MTLESYLSNGWIRKEHLGQLGGHRTKSEAVNEALAEYVARRKRRQVVEIFGTADWDPDYDYKAARKRPSD